MAGPSFSLPTTGTDPKAATKSGLEMSVQAGFDALQGGIDATAAKVVGGLATETALRTADDAALATALASNGKIYTSTASGIAATSPGQTFVAFISGELRIYTNSAGTAALAGAFAPVQALLAMSWMPRASEPWHADYKIRLGNAWYSPDPLVLVFAGQSNALGVNAATTGDKTQSGNVRAWDYSQGAFVAAQLGHLPFNPDAAAPNSFAYHAAKRIEQKAGRPVVLIGKAVSGSAIGSWLTGGENWTALTGADCCCSRSRRRHATWARPRWMVSCGIRASTSSDTGLALQFEPRKVPHPDPTGEVGLVGSERHPVRCGRDAAPRGRRRRLRCDFRMAQAGRLG